MYPSDALLALPITLYAQLASRYANTKYIYHLWFLKARLASIRFWYSREFTTVGTYHSDLTTIHSRQSHFGALDCGLRGDQPSFLACNISLNRIGRMGENMRMKPKVAWAPGFITLFQINPKKSRSQSLKVEPWHTLLSMNARSESVRVTLSPNQRNRTKVPRVRTMRRWDMICL